MGWNRNDRALRQSTRITVISGISGAIAIVSGYNNDKTSAHRRQHPPRETVRRNSRCKFPSRSIPPVVGKPYLTRLGKSCPSLAKWVSPYNLDLHFATNEQLFPKTLFVNRKVDEPFLPLG